MTFCRNIGDILWLTSKHNIKKVLFQHISSIFIDLIYREVAKMFIKCYFHMIKHILSNNLNANKFDIVLLFTVFSNDFFSIWF